jgi:hypothetical protein
VIAWGVVLTEVRRRVEQHLGPLQRRLEPGDVGHVAYDELDVEITEYAIRFLQ